MQRTAKIYEEKTDENQWYSVKKLVNTEKIMIKYT